MPEYRRSFIPGGKYFFTGVMYCQYVRMGWYDAGWGGELEDNIDVIGGE